MKKIKLFFYAASIAVFLGSCSGKDGAPGATGPAGNANVENCIFNNQGLSYVSANSDYEDNLSIPAITSSLLNQDAVEVFVQPSTNTTGWAILPANIGVQLNVVVSVGEVTISTSSASSGYLNFRVVIIPPSLQKPHINYSNYEEVQKAYNLKD